MPNFENPPNFENRDKKLKDFLDKYFPNSERKQGTTVVINRNEIEDLLIHGFSVENILEQAISRGYTIHGSPYDIETIEPRTPTPTEDSPEEEKQTAIYSTNFPPIALFCAIKSGERANKKTGKESFHTRWGITGEENDERISSCNFAASQEIVDTLDDGWIYFLRIEDTECSGGDFIIREKYVPPVKALVRPKDFKYKIEIIE